MEYIDNTTKYRLILSDVEIEFLLGAVKWFAADIQEPGTPYAVRQIYKAVLSKLKDAEEYEEPRLVVSH